MRVLGFGLSAVMPGIFGVSDTVVKEIRGFTYRFGVLGRAPPARPTHQGRPLHLRRGRCGAEGHHSADVELRRHGHGVDADCLSVWHPYRHRRQVQVGGSPVAPRMALKYATPCRSRPLLILSGIAIGPQRHLQTLQVRGRDALRPEQLAGFDPRIGPSDQGGTTPIRLVLGRQAQQFKATLG
jgi:hypothetical protein